MTRSPLHVATTSRWPSRVLIVAWCALAVPGAFAQDTATDETTSLASESVGASVAGQGGLAVPFTLTPSGPRFALAPIARALGVELRIGPKGESHTLIFEDRRVIVGPEQALMVTVSTTRESQEKIEPLSGLPLQDAQGLKVPLDFLEKTFGERLNFQFDWDPELRHLDISRPEVRELEGSVNVVHQHGFTTVEARFSKRPRYRIERTVDALEIHLRGDRLLLPAGLPAVADPLVNAIDAEPGLLRIRLAADASAQDPRLQASGSSTSLVVDVFRGAVRAPQAPGSPRRPTATRKPGTLRTIVLDPGHGGEATGAVGPSGLKEADLALQVGRLLRDRLTARLPVEVIMTRNGDYDLPHDARTAIANQNKADLFISLHFNSSFGRYAHGAETYFLSREASDEIAAAAAATENRGSTDGDAASDPELDLKLILWDLAQSYHLAESQRFANLVQEELNLALGLRDRGVKQAPFRVLMGAQMPAVLVELGFLSNPEEEAKLQRPDYQRELVNSLVRAVVRLKTQIEARHSATAGAPVDPAAGEPASSAQPTTSGAERR